MKYAYIEQQNNKTDQILAAKKKDLNADTSALEKKDRWTKWGQRPVFEEKTIPIIPRAEGGREKSAEAWKRGSAQASKYQRVRASKFHRDIVQ